MAESKTLTATFENDAWEFFYGLLVEWTEKNVAVRLTLLDGSTQVCRLHSINSDEVWDTPQNDSDPMPVVIVTNDLLSATDEPSTTWEVPLYVKTDTYYDCNIVGIHVL